MNEHTKGYDITEDGKVFSISSNWRGYGKREMNQIENVYGYMFVRLTVNGKRTTKLVHVLVCEKYHGEKPTSKHQVRHLDGNKKNNNKNNLMWGTAKENADDRSLHNRTSKGYSHSLSIRKKLTNALTESEINLIKNLNSIGLSQREIAYKVGRSQSSVGCVIRSVR